MTAVRTQKEKETQSTVSSNTMNDSKHCLTVSDNDTVSRASKTTDIVTATTTTTTTLSAVTLATLMEKVSKLQHQLHEELMRDEQDLMDQLRTKVNALNAELEQEQQGRIARCQNTLVACQERIQNLTRQAQLAKVECSIPVRQELDSGNGNDDDDDDHDDAEAKDAFDASGSVVPFGTVKRKSTLVPPPPHFNSSFSSATFDYPATASIADDQSVDAASYSNNSVASVGNNSAASSTFGDDRKSVRSKVVSDKHGDQGKYTGIILKSTGLPHGMGRMVYDEGWTYNGSWCHGFWHGRGTAQFVNGDSYTGEYRLNKRHGRGTYRWADGRVYDGDFCAELRHGKGTFTFPDGACYEGEFKDGQREGYGTNKFSGGGYYTGSWLKGRYQGFGECHWENGRVYKGTWRAGKQHGQGVETEADGSVRHEGMWLHGKPVQN